VQITGKYSHKQFKCRECGNIQTEGTNHYGAIYIRCNCCSWKSPLSPIKIFDCIDPLPDGWGIPEEWKLVKLGDIAHISQNSK
jgi:hypothetical protein